MTENEIGTLIVDTAISIHRELGPGLLEHVYEVILAHELQALGLKVNRQVQVPIVFKGIRFDEGFRADMVVEEKVIVELKSAENVTNSHKKQLLTYLNRFYHMFFIGYSYFSLCLFRIYVVVVLCVFSRAINP